VVAGFVVLAAHEGDTGIGPRLGVTVGRKVGNAVQRNRVKRRIREWFRRDRACLRDDLDLVVIGRRAAVGLSGREAAGQLREASGRLGAWRREAACTS
jgi:ribonuclease P protein component